MSCMSCCTSGSLPNRQRIPPHEPAGPEAYPGAQIHVTRAVALPSASCRPLARATLFPIFLFPFWLQVPLQCHHSHQDPVSRLGSPLVTLHVVAQRHPLGTHELASKVANAKGGGIALLHGRKLRLNSTARTAHNLTRAAAHLTTAISLTVDCIPCTHLTGDDRGWRGSDPRARAYVRVGGLR